MPTVDPSVLVDATSWLADPVIWPALFGEEAGNCHPGRLLLL
ncbi:hypothetical protein ABZ807_16170 [Micromonospora sp. NPDC047548]